MRYRVLRGISVAVRDKVLCWEAGDTLTDAPKTAIADWLKIGAIEEADGLGTRAPDVTEMEGGER